MVERPRFENAPGHFVRLVGDEWECRWRPRPDLVERGFTKLTPRLWKGTEPTDAQRQWVSDRCNALQSEMLVWSRGGLPEMMTFDGTLAGLIDCYEKDPQSRARKMRYQSRLHAARLSKVIAQEYGHVQVADIRSRQLITWHEKWSERGVAMSHAIMTRLRALISYGATLLEDDDCLRLTAVMRGLHFQMPPPRRERLTAAQAVAIRRMAHAMGLHSVALAQAIQFEVMLRQKDVIGEWVPQSEPGMSDVARGNYKWLRGIRWSEISENGILTHVTSKRQKEITVDLKLSPMVMEEFAQLPQVPKSGPVIVYESTGWPYDAPQFRVMWRKCAKEAGVPAAVFNMDSRAGAISEASDAGAPLEHIRHAATHSDTAMTQKYSRGSEEKIAEVQRRRAEHRNKK